MISEDFLKDSNRILLQYRKLPFVYFPINQWLNFSPDNEEFIRGKPKLLFLHGQRQRLTNSQVSVWKLFKGRWKWKEKSATIKHPNLTLKKLILGWFFCLSCWIREKSMEKIFTGKIQSGTHIDRCFRSWFLIKETIVPPPYGKDEWFTRKKLWPGIWNSNTKSLLFHSICIISNWILFMFYTKLIFWRFSLFFHNFPSDLNGNKRKLVFLSLRLWTFLFGLKIEMMKKKNFTTRSRFDLGGDFLFLP